MQCVHCVFDTILVGGRLLKMKIVALQYNTSCFLSWSVKLVMSGVKIMQRVGLHARHTIGAPLSYKPDAKFIASLFITKIYGR